MYVIRVIKINQAPSLLLTHVCIIGFHMREGAWGRGYYSFSSNHNDYSQLHRKEYSTFVRNSLREGIYYTFDHRE